MLTIRSEQIKVFDKMTLQNFEDELVEYLKVFAPKLSEILTENGVRHIIRLGIERADKYGFTNRGPTRFYIELMFTLGSYFDTDPQLPWAQDILTDTAIPDQMLRVDKLYQAMNDYLDQVAGAHNEYVLEALEGFSQVRLEEYDFAESDFINRVLVGMRNVYPHKSEYVGEAVLRLIIQRGIVLAEKYQVATGLGQALMVALMFGFGHGVVDDPLYPWTAATLNDTSVTDSSDRSRRLYQKTKLYVSRILQQLG